MAVPVEEPALAAVAVLLDRLRGEVDAVRWVRPEGVHLTVRFLGALAAERRSLVVQVMRGAAAQGFAIALQGLGQFPARPGVARVLWAGVAAGTQELSELAARVEEGLAAAGFEPERRRFRAHLTLGRPRPPWPVPAQGAWGVVQGSSWFAAPFDARRLVLFESAPGAGGSRYLARDTVMLRP